MTLQHTKVHILLLSLTLLSVLSGCSIPPGDSGVGQLVVRITDGPFPIDMVDYVNVTINKVEVRSVNSDSGNPYITLTDSGFSKTFDLLQLQNGVSDDVVQMGVPTGSYDLIRLYVDSAEIKVRGGDTYTLRVPSGSQTGIKVFVSPPINVAEDLLAELLLDFDLNKSFVVQGNPRTPASIKGFSFKPVIKAINQSASGSISGTVTDLLGVAIQNATVYTEITTSDTLFTATDSDGFYAFVSLVAGSYQVTAYSPVHNSVTAGNVQVIAGKNVEQNFALPPQ